MLHLVAWVAIYTLVLWAVGGLIKPWRDRTWFKMLFLPGTLVAALIQSISALLCFGSVKEVHFFRDGKPFLEFDKSRIPYLGGGLFVLLSHAVLFTGFFFAASQLETAGLVDAHAVVLPNLSPLDLLEGEVELSAGPYFESVVAWMQTLVDQPVSSAIFVYAVLSLFASMSMAGAEWRRGAVVLSAIGFVCYAGVWLGVGFSFFSRGWRASWSVFPEWWEVFSLFVTLAALTFVFFVGAKMALACCARASKPPKGDGPKAKGKEGKKGKKSKGKEKVAA